MAKTPPADTRRQLPSVDRVLREPAARRLIGLYGREQVRVQARRELDRWRERLVREEGSGDPTSESVAARLEEALSDRLGRGVRRVLNATGVFLHTNLGRAPLPRSVADALPALLDAHCDLELDLDSGRRSDRNRKVEALLVALTGAEAGLIVNNNSGALVLALATLAPGCEVVVSRGELVEIGGSFRIPEILEAAGARLVEVGTTNRTRLDDYRRALSPDTGLLLKVHPSNYRIRGFVESVPESELAGLGREAGVPLVVDEGAGLLRPRSEPQLVDHPSMSELLAAGASLVVGSGDKLLGGPQAGIMVGSEALIDPCRSHPLYRALRPDRMALAALHGVLRRHLAGGSLPLDRLWPEPQEHRARLEAVAERIGAEVVPAEAFVGGGAAPDAPIPGEALALPGGEELVERLRRGRVPVVAYVREERVLLDLRTVNPTDDDGLVEAVLAACREGPDGRGR
jgi:L-seryl-tRNA(Ser) seleniumtransferase